MLNKADYTGRKTRHTCTHTHTLYGAPYIGGFMMHAIDLDRRKQLLIFHIFLQTCLLKDYTAWLWQLQWVALGLVLLPFDETNYSKQLQWPKGILWSYVTSFTLMTKWLLIRYSLLWNVKPRWLTGFEVFRFYVHMRVLCGWRVYVLHWHVRDVPGIFDYKARYHTNIKEKQI